MENLRHQDGFLERGHTVTRLEAFVDAAFAFAVTLLVISLEPPTSIDALLTALRGIPAFAASFVLVAMFWLAHNTWSRRFGLDDRISIGLSLCLVFLVLVYVYPLKMLFASLFHCMSRGALPATFAIGSQNDVKILFICYGLAFATLGTNIALLYVHAFRRRTALRLDVLEQLSTRLNAMAWFVMAIVGVLSLATALALPEAPSQWLLAAPGLVYFLLNLLYPLLAWYGRRETARLTLAGLLPVAVDRANGEPA